MRLMSLILILIALILIVNIAMICWLSDGEDGFLHSVIGIFDDGILRKVPVVIEFVMFFYGIFGR